MGYDFAIGVPVVPDVGGGFYLTQSPRSPQRIFITQRRRAAEGVGGAAMRGGARWPRGRGRSHQLSAHRIHKFSRTLIMVTGCNHSPGLSRAAERTDRIASRVEAVA